VEHHGVRVVGMSNPRGDGASASFMFANNVLKLLALFGRRAIGADWNDEVVIGRHRRS